MTKLALVPAATAPEKLPDAEYTKLCRELVATQLRKQFRVIDNSKLPQVWSEPS